MVLENIQVIVVCVNYFDFLNITYQKNIRFFKPDNYHIITTSGDEKTIELCKQLNITYHLYDEFYINSSKFNKSGAIKWMQKKLYKEYPEDWILLLDGDIILPDHFDELFIKKCTNKKAMYSFKRKDYEEKEHYLNSTNLIDYCGINFMGFMQLYHDKTKFYPDFSKDCSTCDMIFRDYFFDYLILMDDDLYVIHLGKNEVNNKGRITEYW